MPPHARGYGFPRYVGGVPNVPHFSHSPFASKIPSAQMNRETDEDCWVGGDFVQSKCAGTRCFSAVFFFGLELNEQFFCCLFFYCASVIQSARLKIPAAENRLNYHFGHFLQANFDKKAEDFGAKHRKEGFDLFWGRGCPRLNPPLLINPQGCWSAEGGGYQSRNSW